MALKCDGCGNAHAYRLSVRLLPEGKFRDFCERCGDTGGSTWIPDVYWPGYAYRSANITDAKGEPILLTSRRHKANVMREQGIREAGDLHHGSRYGALGAIAQRPKPDSRAEIRSALRQAAEQIRRKHGR